MGRRLRATALPEAQRRANVDNMIVARLRRDEEGV
jgi:hypothetical protein